MSDNNENPYGKYIDTPENLKKKQNKIYELARDNPVQNAWEGIKKLMKPKDEKKSGLL